MYFHCVLEFSIVCSYSFLYLLVVIEEVRINSVMEGEKCTIIVFGRLDFFSCHRKYILCWAFLARELMVSSYLRSRMMKVGVQEADPTVSTGK